MVWETLIVANKGQPIADLSGLALDDARPGQYLRDEQVDRAMSCIRALALVLARQAAREDDAIERNAVGSAPASSNTLDTSTNLGGD
jgi:antitoxin (DNA-binding transcriptional repressor) of toxin-antitoxin stability system